MDWWLILIIVFAAFILLIFFLYILKLYLRRGRYTKSNKITNKIVVITGANTGIGKETAIDLAKRGGKIYIACRDESRGQNALKEIIERSGSDQVYFLKMDLASLSSIREFSRKFHELESQLDILICNAGVMTIPYGTTEDGFEMQLGVNHLGHFLLTNLLLDLIKAATASRIVVVSSVAHFGSDINKDDLLSEKSYNKYKAYSQSKLANILFVKGLTKRLEGTGITANACHPGVVDTELGRYLFNPTFRKYCLEPFVKPFVKTPIEGAQTQIRLAVDPDLDGVTGKYFSDCRQARMSRQAQNLETAEWLWKKSESLVNPT